MKKTLIVNLYGGPGSGKSTMAARVFAELKDLGINCELATEYAKDVTWQKGFHVLGNQVYIFAKQQHRIWRLDGQVEVIITDAPLLNSLVYASDETSETFKSLVKEEYAKRPSLDIFLRRVKPYNPSGRSQSEDEAKSLDEKIFFILKECGVNAHELNGEKSTAEHIVKFIKMKLEKMTPLTLNEIS